MRSSTMSTRAGSCSAPTRTDGWSGSERSFRTSAVQSRQLAFLHVSEAFRAAGIGSRLCDDLELVARRAGDCEIVVSATPSHNTVRFYSRRSYKLMAEPLQELSELEPEDVHMKKML